MRNKALLFAVTVAALMVLAYFLPKEYLAYDREKFLHGEVWRALTCYFDHRSVLHLLTSAALFLTAGFWAKARGDTRFSHALFFSALVISGVFLGLMHKSAAIVGFSPLNSALFAFLCFREVERVEGRSRFWNVVLVLVFLRPLVELFFGVTLLTGAPDVPELRALPAAHFTGAVAGALAGHYFRPRRAKAPSEEGNS